jgi:hypothetical protein
MALQNPASLVDAVAAQCSTGNKHCCLGGGPSATQLLPRDRRLHARQHGPQKKDLQQQYPARAGARGGVPRPRRAEAGQHTRMRLYRGGGRGHPKHRCDVQKWSSAFISFPESYRRSAHPNKRFLGKRLLCLRRGEESPSPQCKTKSVMHARVCLYRGGSKRPPKRRCDVQMSTQKVVLARIALAARSVQPTCSAWLRRQKSSAVRDAGRRPA